MTNHFKKEVLSLLDTMTPLKIFVPSNGPFWWAMMTRPPVQQKGAISPWREIVPFLLQHAVEVGRASTVFPVSRFLFHASLANQITKGALHCRPGEAQVRGDCADSIPAFPFPVGPIMKIHTDRLGSWGQLVICIDSIKMAHVIPSLFV